jgi:hypothetical protein
MPVPIGSACISTMQQRQVQMTQHHNQCSDAPVEPCQPATDCQLSTETCTVVENGRVVVKKVLPRENSCSQYSDDHRPCDR